VEKSVMRIESSWGFMGRRGT